MSNPVIEKNVVLRFPNKTSFSSMTIVQKNQNLLYLANVLCTELGLVIFTDLTIEDETKGNVYFLGYENDPKAIFCIYFPRNYTSSTHCYTLNFIDSNNNPLNPAFNQTSNSYYGPSFAISSSYLSYEYCSGFSYIKSDNFFYITAYVSNSYSELSSLITQLNTQRKSYNDYKFGYDKINNKKIRVYNSSFYIVDMYPRTGEYWNPTNVSKDNIYLLMGVRANYYIDKSYLYYSATGDYYELPYKIIYTRINYGPGTVLLIDEKYYLVIGGYDAYQRYIMEIDGPPQAG